MNVLAYGEAGTGEKFKFWTRTVSVSAHGGVMVLDTSLAVGQRFQLMNEYTAKKAQAKVVSVRSGRDGMVHAAFEFVGGGEKFWSMVFPVAGAKPLRRVMGRGESGR